MKTPPASVALLAWNLCSSSCSLLSAGVIGLCHHALSDGCFVFVLTVLRIDPGPYTGQASFQTTELHS